MSEQNKALVRRLYDAFNDGDIDRIGEVCTEGFTYHGPGRELAGLEATKDLMRMYRGAFSDARLTILDQIAEGDKVVTRCRANGTHDGNLDTIPASGNPINLALIAIHRVEDGRLAEEWELFEELQMLQQMGVIPVEEAAAVEETAAV